MVRPSAGTDEFGFDDNGLQDAFLETSDCIGWNDFEDFPLSHCEAIPTGREGDESTEIATDQGKSYQAEPSVDGSVNISVGVPPGTVGAINDEETKQLIPNNENETKSSTDQTDNLDLSVCQKKGPENVDGRSTIRSGELEVKGAKFRSGRSAADGDCLKSNTDPEKLSLLATFPAKFRATISWQLLTSVTVGILFLMPVGVEGELTSVPVNTLVVVGRTARINCSTNTSHPVYWARALAGSHVQHWLYYGNDGFNGHNADNRFSIDDEVTGRYDVIIADVQLKDAGQYVCVDESGIGARASAELIVSAPIKCNFHVPSEGVMAYNVFGLEQDVIQIHCSLTYTGNLSPTLEWSWPGSEVKRGEPTVTATSSSVTSTLKLSATKGYNNVKFQCKANIEGATQPTNDSGLLWESETVNVRYAEFASEEVSVCPGVKWNLLCNPQCSYSFERNNDDHCQCLYTYNDHKTQQMYEVTSDVVRCVKDSVSLLAVLVPVAVVAALLIATITIVLVCCIKKKRMKGQLDDCGESGQNNSKKALVEPMLI